jgi:hypothetical protein
MKDLSFVIAVNDIIVLFRVMNGQKIAMNSTLRTMMCKNIIIMCMALALFHRGEVHHANFHLYFSVCFQGTVDTGEDDDDCRVPFNIECVMTRVTPIEKIRASNSTS